MESLFSLEKILKNYGNYNYQIIYLNENKSSYVIYIKNFLEDIDYNFEELWNLHPDKYKTIFIYNKIVKLPRYVKNYLRDYYFSGKLFEADILPDQFKLIVDKLQKIVIDKNNKTMLNECLINWYEKQHYIGPHSDAEKDLINGAPILTLSLGETRKFRLVPKNNFLTNFRKDIEVKNEDLLIMCGDTQLTHTHEITKTKRNINPRISITMRCFK